MEYNRKNYSLTTPPANHSFSTNNNNFFSNITNGSIGVDGSGISSPNNSCNRQNSPCNRNQFVTKSLDIYLESKRSRQSLKWGFVNIILLLILLYDLSNKCPYGYSKWYYVEYFAVIIFGISIIYYFGKYFTYRFNFEPIRGTEAQRRLLNFAEKDGSFLTMPNTPITKPITNDSVNISSLSWHSSFNDSNRTVGLSGWNYKHPSSPPKPQPHLSQNTSFNQNNLSPSFSSSFISPYKRYTNDEIITDEHRLQQYLQETALLEKNKPNTSDIYDVTDRNSMNSFWNYCNNAVNLLKTSLYQMAPTTTVSPIKQTGVTGDATGNSSISGGIAPVGAIVNTSVSGGSGIDEVTGFFNGNDFDGNSELIKKISSAQLSKYVTNLRMWISATILERLIIEIHKIDTAFKSRGFSDLQIGNIGLERLKKTAENQQIVTLHVPMLPIVVPFLEMSTNQEYLVQRIKQLGKSSCIADYRWNSGSSYHGLNWDEHLPTDSAILFHLFCSYMDSQLMPLPQPGGRPFYNRYVVLGDKKSPRETIIEVKNKSRCAILYTNSVKPKFNFISDDKIHNCIHDRNNLFYVIIQFLLYMKTHHESLLEGVNLGKSGINILCVVED